MWNVSVHRVLVSKEIDKAEQFEYAAYIVYAYKDEIGSGSTSTPNWRKKIILSDFCLEERDFQDRCP